ncbi:glycosyltransferase [Akkermansiaceae bacterium]|jgi:glycosyltransferase involved in cell wall biosynthesis|nr:glycosyltransferase [bacterium]MDA7892060.1 glycosyltransferase [Akkermansiaceae bacterium]MDA7907865.1 glycosyltransferase [Akkermansiaceae bacterium]MDA7934377.1 glycosyltransferase [Akkermansiaceae bacterium]MDB4370112.1 glycosyltransferase [Akkermansiaceae bacterium]
MKVCVASPYPLSELKGNSVTTDRIVAILREGGVDARGSHGYDNEPADVLISLHAVKGAPAVFDFQQKLPIGKVIVLLTGTDIYEGLPEGSQIGHDALRAADRIVVPQEAVIRRLPEEVRKKTLVIRASLDPISIKAAPILSPFVISVVGHPRPVKRPFLTIETVARHPEWRDIEVWQIGQALDEESRKTAESWAQKEKRYRWFGGLPREESLARCAASSLTINSSVLEGGANAVLEAMTMGVPVLASRIEGNVGLLGEGYPGYFDEGGLGDALQIILEKGVDLGDWVRLASERLGLFSRESESTSWLELLAKLN